MPNHTTYVLDALERMIDAKTPEDLRAVRVIYKSDVIADAYAFLIEEFKARIHELMKGAKSNA